jgi:hypothetical protein
MTGPSLIFILTESSSFLKRYEYHVETVPVRFGSSTTIGGRELYKDTRGKRNFGQYPFLVSPIAFYSILLYISI